MEKYLIKIQFERSDFDDVDFFYSLKQQIYNNFVKQLYNYFTSVNVIYIENNIDITKKFSRRSNTPYQTGSNKFRFISI